MAPCTFHSIASSVLGADDLHRHDAVLLHDPLAPGGPFNLERPLAPEVLANLNAVYHLDQPVWKQYVFYLWNVLHGDFGPSFVYKDYTVSELIMQALPYSLVLGAWALVIAVFGGIALGVYAALRQNSWPITC